jgi:predicted component of type VI protein secretion system
MSVLRSKIPSLIESSKATPVVQSRKSLSVNSNLFPESLRQVKSPPTMCRENTLAVHAKNKIKISVNCLRIGEPSSVISELLLSANGKFRNKFTEIVLAVNRNLGK